MAKDIEQYNIIQEKLNAMGLQLQDKIKEYNALQDSIQKN